jgi:hypothetical protein
MDPIKIRPCVPRTEKVAYYHGLELTQHEQTLLMMCTKFVLLLYPFTNMRITWTSQSEIDEHGELEQTKRRMVGLLVHVHDMQCKLRSFACRGTTRIHGFAMDD